MRGQGFGRSATAVLAVVIALGCLDVIVSACVKTYETYLSRERLKPTLIRCAGVSQGSPCFPDPGMQRLGLPPPLPDTPPQPDPPQFGPSR
jgi:hypothetical protein